MVWWWKGESKVESFVYFQPVFACFCKLYSICSWLDELFLIWLGEVNIMINKICKDNVFLIRVMVKTSVEDWEFWSIFSHFLLVISSWYEYLSQILLWYQVSQHFFCIWCLVCKFELDLLASRNVENVGQNQWVVSWSVFLLVCWYGFPERFAMLALSLCHLLIIWDGTWSRCGFLACSLCKVNGKVSCSIQSDHSMFAESSLLRYLVTVPCYKLKCWTPHLNISF